VRTVASMVTLVTSSLRMCETHHGGMRSLNIRVLNSRVLFPGSTWSPAFEPRAISTSFIMTV